MENKHKNVCMGTCQNLTQFCEDVQGDIRPSAKFCKIVAVKYMLETFAAHKLATHARLWADLPDSANGSGKALELTDSFMGGPKLLRQVLDTLLELLILSL
eukprot:802594-Pelagomonas_calceolata.AAC.4